ncbi:MAG: hypothetical protein V3W34_03390 [Phycisphaerae bacterium]
MRTDTEPRPKRPQMTEAEARIFEDGERVTSAARFATARNARVAAGAHPADCTCEAYRDAYTCRRWNAQGQRVRKGAKAFVLPRWIEEDDQDGNKRKRLIKARSYVFCRCQVGTGKGRSFGYSVGEDMLAAERRRTPIRTNGNGSTTKREHKPAPPPPAHQTLPEKWLEQLMYEVNCKAPKERRAVGVTNEEELKHLNACLRARHRLAVWAPGVMQDSLHIANLVNDCLEPGGVGVALVRRLDTDQADKCKRAGVQAVDVGEIDFGSFRAECSVVRITKGTNQ